MKISFAVLIILSIFKRYEATVNELNEVERHTLVTNINTLRATKGSNDMTKMCWKEDVAERVRQAATNCDSVMQYQDTIYISKTQISQTAPDEMANFVSILYNHMRSKNTQMSDCEYNDDCGAAKIIMTARVSEIFCVKASCSGNPNIYCGFPLSSQLQVSMPAFQQGTACDACGVDDTCENGLCITAACMPPTTTTTTTTTTMKMMPVVDESPLMNGTMPTHDDSYKNSNHEFMLRAFYSASSTLRMSYYTLTILVLILFYSH